ncbi:hypothetical protein V6N13_119295 [Hibiscus sabdariffa]
MVGVVSSGQFRSLLKKERTMKRRKQMFGLQRKFCPSINIFICLIIALDLFLFVFLEVLDLSPLCFLFIITRYCNHETIGNFDARHIQPMMQALPLPATYNAHHERVLSAKFFW